MASLERLRETGVYPERVSKRKRPVATEEELASARQRSAERHNRQPNPKFAHRREAKRMRAESGSVLCGICQDRLSGSKRYVDHCHVTLKVRGFLCGRCNSGLGMFKDNLALLRHAITYLERHGSWSITKKET